MYGKAHSAVLACSAGASACMHLPIASQLSQFSPARPHEKPAPEGRCMVVGALTHAHVPARAGSREPHCSPHSPATERWRQELAAACMHGGQARYPPTKAHGSAPPRPATAHACDVSRRHTPLRLPGLHAPSRAYLIPRRICALIYS